MVDKNNKDNSVLKELRRYFSGKHSEKGEYIFNKWFNSFDNSEGYVDSLNQEKREQHQRRLFHSLKKNLQLPDNSFAKPEEARRYGRWAMLYKVAAILVIGGALAVAGVYMSGVSEPAPAPVAMIQKSNPIGQISIFMLPDGSRVWLSAASTLEYPEEFQETNRTIDLEGEAFFEVTRDATRPFIVNSGPLSTRVLGTSFDVKAYQDDPVIGVTLVRGEVEVTVNGGSKKQILAPNQQISYEKESGLSEVREIDASLVKAWTRQEFVFMRESFSTIARTFERWYGVEFVFEDEALKEETFVYHFKQLSLQNSLIILSEMADFEYEILRQKVIIRNARVENE